MSNPPPAHYSNTRDRYPDLFDALEQVGVTARRCGPLAEKQCQLIQLAAAAALQSEGAVHSHARRAVKAGASSEEIRHAILLLVSTIGLPRTMAAMSWVEETIA